MKTLFPGYYEPSPEEFDRLWKEAIFTFDANVLLNLYRYSPDTRDALISTLKSLQDRLWLPHQAALEYHRNRLDSISHELNPYDDLPKSLRIAHARLKSSTQHPFAEKETVDGLGSLLDKLEKELNASKERQTKLLRSDPILADVTTLFDGRVSAPFDSAKIDEIIKEGKERYAKKIPPGYRDASKPDDKAFGDLIIWKQLLEKAKQHTKGIILVTNDAKEDWWQQLQNGERLGPRPELRHEMQEVAKSAFYMYSAETFLERAGVKPAVIQEVKDVAQERRDTLEVILTDYSRASDTVTATRTTPAPQSKLFRLVMLQEYQGISLEIEEWCRRMLEPNADQVSLLVSFVPLRGRIDEFEGKWSTFLSPAALALLKSINQLSDTMMLRLTDSQRQKLVPAFRDNVLGLLNIVAH